jgi:hypothetical protein
MIEIRVHENIDRISVDRDLKPEIVVSVPKNSSWFELNQHLIDHLNGDEIDLARKIWCQDDFPRTFEEGNGFVAIRPAVS